jgi:hypothetical protein
MSFGPVNDPARFSPGTQFSRMLESTGFPETLSNLYGAALDKACGNQLGVARNLFDAFSGLTTSQLDKFTSMGFSPPGFCPRPHEDFGRNFGMCRPTYYDRESISTVPKEGLAGLFGQKDVMIDGKKIDVGPEGKPGVPRDPKAIEEKILTDPAFRSKIESQVGGRIVLDGNADGNITIAKKLPHFPGPYQNNIMQNVGNFLQRAMQPPFGIMNQVMGQLGNFLNGIGGGGFPGLPGIPGFPGGGGPFGPSGPNAPSGGPGGAGGAGGGGKLDAILHSGMSFEAMLNAFLIEFVKEKQDQMKAKMKELADAQKKEQAGGQGGPGGAGGGGKPGGGGLGSIVGMAGGVIGGMYGGPVGAGMGQQIGSAGGNMLGGLLGGAGGGAGGPGGAGGADEQKSTQELTNELKQMQDELKSMTDACDSIRSMSQQSIQKIWQ